MQEHGITLKFDSYIAHPYWKEKDEIVNILKQSGYNRARSEDNREKTLRLFLEKQGMTMEDYKALEKLANREWYRVGGEESEIVIPRHQIGGTLVQATQGAPAGSRFNQEQLRSLIQISDLRTGKTKCDEVFSRFVMPKDGSGRPLSNQRALRGNEVIKGFEATGVVRFDLNDVKLKALQELLRYAGKYVGVGAARKMGYGRFELVSLSQ